MGPRSQRRKRIRVGAKGKGTEEPERQIPLCHCRPALSHICEGDQATCLRAA